MGWQKVTTLAELAEGSVQLFPREDGDFLVCKVEGAVYALDNECPHAGGPLAMGNFCPPLIACPWHAWEFDCRTGECVHSAKAKVPTYLVEIRDDEVWVELPNPLPNGGI